MRSYLFCGAVALLCLPVHAQDSPVQECPEVLELTSDKFRFYILDEYNNRIYYECVDGEDGVEMVRNTCPENRCADLGRDVTAGELNKHRSPCPRSADTKICREGYELPPPAPIEACWLQGSVLDSEAEPQPVNSTACGTACYVEFDSAARILIRGCQHPSQMLEAGCYGDLDKLIYVCEDNMCNVRLLPMIGDLCEDNFSPMPSADFFESDF